MNDTILLDGDMMYLASRPNIKVHLNLHPKLLFMLQEISTDADIVIDDSRIMISRDRYTLKFGYSMPKYDYKDSTRNIGAIKDIVEIMVYMFDKIVQEELYSIDSDDVWQEIAVEIRFSNNYWKYYHLSKQNEEKQFIEFLLSILDKN